MVGGEWKAEEMQFLLSKLNIAEDEWPDIIRTTCSDDATPFLGDHVRKMLQDMFTATFFEMTDVGVKIATHRGTRPGDPVGDILFNMLFRLILKDVRIELQHHPEAEWIGTPFDGEGVFNNGPIPCTAFAEIAFVDDVAYIVHSKTPEKTVSLVQAILSAFKDAAAKRGVLAPEPARHSSGTPCMGESPSFQRMRLVRFNWCIITSTWAASFKRRPLLRRTAIAVLLKHAKRLEYWFVLSLPSPS